ncbi:juvenile hormone esterase-like [Pectinophora gossypiella]|uniref:juvenile hormone esterase-like n=1 Tax=Pectinophora gossypiella TaxID=13191 RepID=UPI00214EB93E|nr:juvenile hormone esterase-like [Pectinophora gossypiella]
MFHTTLLVCMVGMVSAILPSDRIVVYTKSGPIRGKVVSDTNVHYYSYQGIPYAESPTGDLRFKPPVPKSPWNKIRNATKEGSICPQSDAKPEEMSEDCLFINIYVPYIRLGKLSVLVYVHGGEFLSNSGNSDNQYGPQLLLKHGIILVTLNYRIGALGFLSLGVEDASGNAGIKDVLLALRWINDNIDRFGGDTSRITLGGNSAGAVLVHYLLLSAKSSGLFKQAILISGSALGYRFLARHAKENALALGKYLDLQTENRQDLLQKLKEIDALEIVKAQKDMGKNDTRKGLRTFAPFVPCVEIEHKNAVITKYPKDIIASGIPQNVPILAGFNSDEGLKMYPAVKKDPTLIDYLNENVELLIPSDIEYPYGSNESTNVATRIREFYFNGTTISKDVTQGYVDFITDGMFSFAINSWVKLHKQRKDSKNVYYYAFDFEGSLNYNKINNNIDRPGTSHADELGYLFVTKVTRPYLNNIDKKSERMVNIWTSTVANFVKFGDPTQILYNLGGIDWLESSSNLNHFRLADLENRNEAPRARFLQFWSEIYNEYDEYVRNGGQLMQKIVP